MNLAINARDAMPKGGRLTIGSSNVEISGEVPGCTPAVPGSYVALTVSDTGCGMDRETMSHIFEPFFTTKPVGKGTGLGLSTVYGIVQQSGGCICLNSEPNKGTTFRICLPSFAGPDSVLPSGAVQARQRAESKTVLLVEDEEALRESIATQLEAAGYRVLRAEEGNAALLAAQSHKEPIDLLITDIVMPKMSGQELAARLQLAHPETRVLYMSGYADDIVLGGLDGLAFIQKPFPFAEVINKVREILEASPAK
jgi:CheY-like chemotaxis protein